MKAFCLKIGRWFWALLNSPLAICLISTAGVGLVTYCYTERRERFERERERDQVVRAVNVELKLRLSTFDEDLQVIADELDGEIARGKGGDPNQALEERLRSACNEVEMPSLPAYPEHRARGLYSLLIQLQENMGTGEPENGDPLKAAMKAQRKLRSVAAGFNKSTSVATLRGIAGQLLKLLNEGPLREWAKPEAWKYGGFGYYESVHVPRLTLESTPAIPRASVVPRQ